MSLVWASLWLWSSVAASAGCVMAAGLLVALAASVTLSATEAAFHRRRALLAQYLSRRGRLFGLLRGRVVTPVWQGIKALGLAVVLMTSGLTLEPWQWLLLLADLLVLAGLIGAIARALQAEVHAPYVAPLARKWAVAANAAILWAALLLGFFYTARENFAGLGWEEVVAFAASRVEVGCEALAVIARLAGVGEALALWGAQNLLPGLARPEQVAAAWVAFVAAFGVSFLFAWGYSRALAGTLSRPWQVWGEESGPG
jgi:hypothetical protein